VLAATVGLALFVDFQGGPEDVASSGAPPSSGDMAVRTQSPPSEGGPLLEGYSGAESSAADGSGNAASPDAKGTDSLIIRNAAMEIRVDDVDVALASLRSAVAKSGGEIADMSMTAGDPGLVPLDSGSAPIAGPSIAYVTVRVPSDRLAGLEIAVAKLGHVLTQSASSSDVTEQAIDMEARLKNLRAEEARLRSLFSRTDDVSDLLEVERELSRVRGEIEAMEAQLTYLERQAARATLTVTLSEPGPVVQPAGSSWGLREAVTRGIQATVALLAATVTAAIPIAVFGAIAFAVWLPIHAVLARRRARAHDASASGDSASGGDTP
jgi:hypothetical protein